MSVDFLKFNAKNQNTTKATESWYRKYCKWAEKTKNVKEIQNVDLRNRICLENPDIYHILMWRINNYYVHCSANINLLFTGKERGRRCSPPLR